MSRAPEWEVEGRDWPNRAASRFVDTGRIRWHVQVMGPKNLEAPVLLLIHGTGAATHSWRELAPLLAERFTVVAADLPGHGFPPGPRRRLTMTAMARALGELLAALAVEPAAIVGHSAGAAIGIRIALDRIASPRAIVGLDAALLPFPGLGAAIFPTLARLLFVNPFAPHLFARVARTPGETGRFLARSTGSTIDAGGVDYYRRLFATPAHCGGALAMMADWDLAALKRDLPRLAVPLLLIHGDSDAAIAPANAREAAALVPGAELNMLPGLGHLAHEERPGEVAAMIEAFVGGK